jgi:hypothetical protein
MAFAAFDLYILLCVSSVSWLFKLLMVLANKVTLVSGSCGIYYHIFLSHHYGKCAATQQKMIFQEINISQIEFYFLLQQDAHYENTLLALRVSLGQVRLG